MSWEQRMQAAVDEWGRQRAQVAVEPSGPSEPDDPAEIQRRIDRLTT